MGDERSRWARRDLLIALRQELMEPTSSVVYIRHFLNVTVAADVFLRSEPSRRSSGRRGWTRTNNWRPAFCGLLWMRIDCGGPSRCFNGPGGIGVIPVDPSEN